MDYKARKKVEQINHPYLAELHPFQEAATKNWAEAYSPLIEEKRGGPKVGVGQRIKMSAWDLINDMTDLASVDEDPDAIRAKALKEALLDVDRHRSGLKDGSVNTSFDEYVKSSPWTRLKNDGWTD